MRWKGQANAGKRLDPRPGALLEVPFTEAGESSPNALCMCAPPAPQPSHSTVSHFPLFSSLPYAFPTAPPHLSLARPSRHGPLEFVPWAPGVTLEALVFAALVDRQGPDPPPPPPPTLAQRALDRAAAQAAAAEEDDSYEAMLGLPSQRADGGPRATVRMADLDDEGVFEGDSADEEEGSDAGPSDDEALGRELGLEPGQVRAALRASRRRRLAPEPELVETAAPGAGWEWIDDGEGRVRVGCRHGIMRPDTVPEQRAGKAPPRSQQPVQLVSEPAVPPPARAAEPLPARVAEPAVVVEHAVDPRRLRAALAAAAPVRRVEPAVPAAEVSDEDVSHDPFKPVPPSPLVEPPRDGRPAATSQQLRAASRFEAPPPLDSLAARVGGGEAGTRSGTRLMGFLTAVMLLLALYASRTLAAASRLAASAAADARAAAAYAAALRPEAPLLIDPAILPAAQQAAAEAAAVAAAEAAAAADTAAEEAQMERLRASLATAQAMLAELGGSEGPLLSDDPAQALDLVKAALQASRRGSEQATREVLQAEAARGVAEAAAAAAVERHAAVVAAAAAEAAQAAAVAEEAVSQSSAQEL